MWTIAGFLLPWLLLALAVGSAFAALPLPTVLLTAFAFIADIVGFVLMLAADRRTLRGAGYGAFIAFLTQILAGAIGVVVLFGWCISMLNSV